MNRRIRPQSNRLYKYSVVILLVSFCLTAIGVNAQSFSVSETSSAFINDNDYDSVILDAALPVATAKQISAKELKGRYELSRESFPEAMKIVLSIRFDALDKEYAKVHPPKGTAVYKKARAAYLRQVKQAAENLLGSSKLFSVLFTKDYSDRILVFHSDITVQASGKLLVSEFITIFNGNGQPNSDSDGNGYHSGNNDIQRGILRDFPTSYEGADGFWSSTGFELKAVLKNGVPEPYNTESLTNGTRIKIGSKDIVLQTGIYTYRIDYETDRQLIFHPDKDELYWNVNGNGWVFTADSVSCLIRFPEGASIQEQACYTGPEGSTDHNCTYQAEGLNVISFSASKRLNSREGLTVAASIQKGILIPPGRVESAAAFLKANYIIPSLAIFLVLLFVFYFLIWYYKGRDPRKGVIYPRFSPPSELTPPDAGYIMDQQYASHHFAAALVDCAVKKWLDIEVTREGLLFKTNVYNFNRPATAKDIPSTDVTYGFNIKSIYGEKVKKGSYNSKFRGFYDSLGETLQKRFLIRKGQRKGYGLFALNKGYTRFGGFLVILAVFLCIKFMIGHPSLRLLMITVLMMAGIIIMHFIFARIMSAYTKQGREIVDHLLGFKMYLETAEQRFYDKLTPPEKTLDLFEKYLPYAIALEVENKWAEKFDSIMQKALENGYQPTYYMSHAGFSNFSMSDMSHGISLGLSGAISSASTPPSSSSGGSGGGGSSGGGGGGGGGGGW